VSIVVHHREDGWQLMVTPPDVVETKTATVSTPTEALGTLASWGCHSTDSTDALDLAEPEWRRIHDEEVLRRRTEG
jgi:hypothetical protein